MPKIVYTQVFVRLLPITSANCIQVMPHTNRTDYGLKEDNGRLIPVWTTLSEAKEVFHVDILCFWKHACSFCGANIRRQT